MRRNMNKFNTMKINVQIHMNGTQLQRQIYELNMSNKEIQKGNYISIQKQPKKKKKKKQYFADYCHHWKTLNIEDHA